MGSVPFRRIQAAEGSSGFMYDMPAGRKQAGVSPDVMPRPDLESDRILEPFAIPEDLAAAPALIQMPGQHEQQIG